jgi:dienelactone hydrolase
LLIGGSEGGLSMPDEAALLASHGFPALDVAYFAAPGLPRNLQRVPLEYFVRAARWLDRQPGVDSRRLVVYGVSRGSEAALLLASHFPRLFPGVVLLSPSSYVKGGFVPGKLAIHGAAWTVGGKPIAYRSRANPTGGTIAFRTVQADVFISAGLEDELGLGYGAEEDILAGLQHLAHRRVVATIYQHAGHFIDAPIPYLPWGRTYFNEALGVTAPVGGTAAGDNTARADEWPRILRFIGSMPR